MISQPRELGGASRSAGFSIAPARRHDDRRYLAALNRCFGHWGDESAFAWNFRQRHGNRRADRFVVSENGEWIAGSAVSWRSLIDEAGVHRTVGIMTASWTLPAARGRGCFAAMIDHSRRKCCEVGADWLLAFVTSDNASRRQLERAGALMIPTAYLWSVENGEAPRESIDLKLADLTLSRVQTCRERHCGQGAGELHFAYGEEDQWRDHWIARPLPTELLSADRLGDVLIEHHPVFDRVLATFPTSDCDRLALLRAACARARRTGRRFFGFSTHPEEADALRRSCGLGGTPGFIAVLPAAAQAPAADAPWHVEGGDRT